MPNIGVSELVVILLILMLVFGASRLPKLGESMGKAISNFKRGIKSDVLAWIEQIWTDMRPKSLRERMEQMRRDDE